MLNNFKCMIWFSKDFDLALHLWSLSISTSVSPSQTAALYPLGSNPISSSLPCHSLCPQHLTSLVLLCKCMYPLSLWLSSLSTVFLRSICVVVCVKVSFFRSEYYWCWGLDPQHPGRNWDLLIIIKLLEGKGRFPWASWLAKPVESKQLKIDWKILPQ